MKYTVVLPTYNESESIGPMTEGLISAGIPGLEILIVDDHSPDGTYEKAQRIAEKYPSVHVMLHEGERGLSPSVLAGFDQSDSEIICCMDADGQHRPEDLKGLLEELESGNCDMMVGSRHVAGGGFKEKWNPVRVLFSRTARLAARLILGVNLLDPMSGFFALRRKSYEKIRPFLSPRGFKILLEMAYLMMLTGKMRIGEHPILFSLRKYGKSKLSVKVVLQYVQMLWTLRRNREKLLKGLRDS